MDWYMYVVDVSLSMTQAISFVRYKIIFKQPKRGLQPELSYKQIKAFSLWH